MAQHGLSEFFTWFDHESWYPLGRPVGTTIYPGLQIVAVALWRVLNQLGYKISLNDVCVYFPAWFGTLATFLLGLLAWECSGSIVAAAISAYIMAIIPAHLMRSVGGGFDNESLAISCLVGTFLLWVRSVRTPGSWWFGALAGGAQLAMAAAWGGYVFVANMVGVHAAVLLLLGRYTPGLHKSYTLWWIIGQLGATTIPVIGSAPYRSLEQIGPLGVFGVLQLLAYCDFEAARKKLNENQLRDLRWRVFAIAGAAAGLVGFGLLVTGFFGPISVRVRSLFVKHSRTGNPLVDSVAEHQPASAAAYMQYLQQGIYLAPIGLIICLFDPTNANLFLVLYGLVSYYFAQKMNRLIILMGPIASALSGVAVERMVRWSFAQLPLYIPQLSFLGEEEQPKAASAAAATATTTSAAAATKEKVKSTNQTPVDSFKTFYHSRNGRIFRFVGALFLVYWLLVSAISFNNNTKFYATQISQPSLMFQSRLQNGELFIVDDYYVGYKWIRENTPQDSRVLSWWDYGYQIAGISNRTTLADGNTWNLEHIALIGKILTSPQKDAHALAKHLADYVLVWAGGGGDDLAKMPHVARIASSVFDICPNDPVCRMFMFDPRGSQKPHPLLKESLLFNLVLNQRHPEARVDERYFREVYSSKYGLLRVYKVMDVSKESKAWATNPANWKCDRPGSWYCPGQYPPAVKPPPSTHKPINYEKHGYN